VTTSRRRTRRPPATTDAAETAVQPRVAADRTEPIERVQRHEERLVPRVTREQAGAVHLRRSVVEEPEEVEVTLRHDELDLERRSADRPLEAGEQPVTERGDTTVVLVVEERLEVRKVPWVVEEIHLRRRLVSEQRRVSDTVRKERFEIETQGDVELTDQT
jgi:uncharacterized protein (TIGR02271 family)